MYRVLYSVFLCLFPVLNKWGRKSEKVGSTSELLLIGITNHQNYLLLELPIIRITYFWNYQSSELPTFGITTHKCWK